MKGLFQDIRYSARKLMRQPGFTLAALFTLALGIGANAVLFTLINALLLRPPGGVPSPESLVRVYKSDHSVSSSPLSASSYADYLDYAKATDVFSGVAVHMAQVVGAGDPADPARIGLETVSDSYFPVLGVPLRGRAFSAQEAETGAQVVVVSHNFWQRHMGATPDAVGRTVQLNGKPMTVIGVAAQGFQGSLRGFETSAWMPFRTAAALGNAAINTNSRGDNSLLVIARLQKGATVETAQRRMNLLAWQLFTAFPDEWSNVEDRGRSLTVLSEKAARIPPQIGKIAYPLTILLSAIVALVLLICCANVAGLMIARASGLTREMGIRVSIGASRMRIARLLLVESALLAIGASAIGLVAAVWIGEIVTQLLPRLPVPISLDFGIDHRVILFTTFLAVFAAMVLGMAPALSASRADPASVIKGNATQAALGRRRFSLRSMLVGAQVAASVVLLVTALLFLRSMGSAMSSDLGFTTENIALLSLASEPGYQPTDEEAARVALAATEILDATPSVRKASWSSAAPLQFEASRRGTMIEHYSPGKGEDMEFHFSMVGPSYLTTIGVPLKRGRDLTVQDRQGSVPAVIVNETFAQRFWPGKDPIGQRISNDGGATFATVVGVAGDARMVEVGTGDIKPYMFFPSLQQGYWGIVLHAQVDNLTAEMLVLLRDRVEQTAPRWKVESQKTMTNQVAASIMPQRIASAVLTL
ncbi:MAG: ABC transporter permease, partial [Acidobacteria bacterium]|nr:ABC transporter permease [Acidobacteriota bacterium]